MLFPQIVDISDKGQILIPASMRRAMDIHPKGKAYLVPDVEKKRIVIKPMKKNIVEELYGKFADIEPERLWTKELVEERRRDAIREEAKFDTLFVSKKVRHEKPHIR